MIADGVEPTPLALCVGDALRRAWLRVGHGLVRGAVRTTCEVGRPAESEIRMQRIPVWISAVVWLEVGECDQDVRTDIDLGNERLGYEFRNRWLLGPTGKLVA